MAEVAKAVLAAWAGPIRRTPRAMKRSMAAGSFAKAPAPSMARKVVMRPGSACCEPEWAAARG